eukprot:scaffold1271_cov167-Amphora_coffeaeformis.AAC.11
MIRRQQEQEERCIATRSVQTIYNDNDLVPSYPGIMFDFVGLAEEIEVLTLEFDARVDDITDYTVEVFVTEGDYTQKLNDESQWTRLAHTKATIAPSGNGLVIPQPDFQPIKLKRGQRRTVYISMNGPWLDTIAQALDKTGEIQIQEQDLALYVGVGLNERFPEDFDKTVDPQFSGVIHYRKEVNCEEALDSTSVDLQFLVAESEDPVFVSRLNKALGELIQNNMLQVPPFSTMTANYKLSQSQAPQISKLVYKDGKCPDEWTTPCPRNILGPRLFFEHTPDLRQGHLKYEIYRFAEALTDLIKMRLSIREVLYIGIVPVMSDYKLSLSGIPSEVTFTDKNRQFLETTSTDFLSRVTSELDTVVEVMDTVITSHETTAQDGIRRYLRGLGNHSTLTVEGSVMGGQAMYLPIENFPIVLRNVVKQNGKDFEEAIRAAAAIMPNDGDVVSAFDYFGSVGSLSASFNTHVVEAGNFEDSSSKTNTTVFLAIGLLILFFAAAGKCGWELYQQSKRKKFVIERQEMIEQKKIEKERRSIQREKLKEVRDKIPTEVHIDSDDEEFKDCQIKDAEKRRGVHRAKSSDGIPGRSESTKDGPRRTHSCSDVLAPSRIPKGFLDSQEPVRNSKDKADLSPELTKGNAHLAVSRDNTKATRSASYNQAREPQFDLPKQEVSRSVSYDEKTRDCLSQQHKVRKGRRPGSREDIADSPQLPKRQASLGSSTKGRLRTVGHVDGIRVKSMTAGTPSPSASRSSSGTGSNRAPSRTSSGDTFAKTRRTPSCTESGDTFAKGHGNGHDRAPRNVERHRSGSVSVARTASTSGHRVQTSSSHDSSQEHSNNDDSLSSLDSSGSFSLGRSSSGRPPLASGSSDKSLRRSAANGPPSTPRRQLSGEVVPDGIRRTVSNSSTSTQRRQPNSDQLRSISQRMPAPPRVGRSPGPPRRSSSQSNNISSSRGSVSEQISFADCGFG